MITYNVHVPMSSSFIASGPKIKCNDTGIKLRIFPELITKISRLRETRSAYAIPADATVVLKIAKPDKTYGVQDGEIRGESIIFSLNPQALTVAGTALAEVNIFGADGRRITTGTFTLDVVKECADGCSQESKTYVDILAEYIMDTKAAAEEAQAAVDDVEQAKEGAETAQKAAESAAKTAVNSAESASVEAEKAKSAAQSAAQGSDAATEAAGRAEAAQNAAETAAEEAANSAESVSDEAKKAESAAQSAAQGSDAATEAAGRAEAAQNAARSAAETAANSAESASVEAEKAESAARSAAQRRDEATAAAERAEAAADSIPPDPASMEDVKSYVDDAAIKNDFELIASGVTTEEVNTIIISTDNDGNPFELCDMINVYAYCPKTNGASNKALTIDFDNYLVHQTTTSALNISTNRYIQFRAVFTGALWDCYSTAIDGGVVNLGASPQSAYSHAKKQAHSNGVQQIKFYIYNSTQPLPIGFEYYIYGRRVKNANT